MTRFQPRPHRRSTFGLCLALSLPLACSSGAGGSGGGDYGGSGNGGSSSGGGKGGSSSDGSGKGGSSSDGSGGASGSGNGSGGDGNGGSGAGGSSSDGGGSGGSAGGGNPNGGDKTSHAAAHPFPSHSFKYPDGVIAPTGGKDKIDADVKAYYDKWKAKYLKQACGAYAIDTSGGTGAFVKETLSVSEGHGYGMVIAALMAGYDAQAKDEFDGLYKLFRAFPSEATTDLMAWQVLKACPTMYPKPITYPGAPPPPPQPAGPIMCSEPLPGCFYIKGMNGDESSATDGDLDIAFALLLADKQWGSGGPINYFAEAQKVIAAIKTKEMNQMSKLPLVADTIKMDSTDYWATRPSDFMIDHFRSYATATGDDFWMGAVDAMHTLIGKVQSQYSPTTGLIPDFVVGTDKDPKPAPPYVPQADEGPTTGEYAYNSCRVPWHLGVDYIVSGDKRAKDALVKLNAFIKARSGGSPIFISDGYKLDGSPGTLPMDQAEHSPEMSFIAPFAVAAIVDGANQKWLDDLWADMQMITSDDAYFGDTIRMLSMVAISGNWWKP